MQRSFEFAYWSPEEAAKLLSVTPDHVRDLCRQGLLTAHRERRRWWIDPPSVARYLARREEGRRA